MEEEVAREVAHCVLEEFEDLLTATEVWIPSTDRSRDPDGAGASSAG